MKTLRNDPICESVYDFVDKYIQEHHYAPSQREIAAACYLGKTTVVRCLDRLEARGLIARDPGRARGIGILRNDR